MLRKRSVCVRSESRSSTRSAFRGLSSRHRPASDRRIVIEPSRGGVLPALTLQGIDKRFGATRALTSASLLVHPGTVHALLGENGAGKSTLMRIAYGMERPDAGTIRVRGAIVRLDSPAHAISHGILSL